MKNSITPAQQLYYAWDLSHKKSTSDDSRFTGVLSEAKVDLSLIHISEPTRPY